MTLAAFVGGLLEAVFLVLVTRTAFAITERDPHVGVISGQSVSVNTALGLGLLIVIARVGVAGLAAWEAARVTTVSVATIRRRLAQAFLSAEWKVQQEQRAGTMQELMGRFSAQAEGIVSGLSGSLTALANLLAMLTVAIAVDPVGAAVTLGAITILGATLRPLRASIRDRSRQVNLASMELGIAVNDVTRLGMELHVFNVQLPAARRLDKHIDAVQRTKRSLLLASSITTTAYTALAFAALLGALAVVSTSNSASLGSLGAALLVMLRSLSYGSALQSSYVSLSSSAPAINDIIDRLEYLESGRRKSGGDPVDAVGQILVREARFAYSADEPVLSNISFSVQPRESLGIVGPSGGGKSTLVQLLLALREPQEGEVLADGRSVSHLAKDSWARRVTFVPQTPHLISGTIAENIRFLRDDVSDEDVVDAAKLAHIHDEIERFPLGYERDVGDQGSNLSGGQQQRLCIARALVERPDVLILDEPTSALDAQSERLIQSTLLDLKKRMTLIIVAHRMSTLDVCDKIMVIQKGRIVAYGASDHLAESNEFFREALHLSGLR